VEFLNGIFYGKSTWFLAQSVNSGQYFIKMKQRIFADIESYSVCYGLLENKTLNSSNVHIMQSDLQKNQVAIACAIRALAGIVGYFGIKLQEAEAVLILKVLGQTNTER
jgi:hypothetical protein